MNSETLRELHVLWEEIQTNLDMSQRKLDEEQRLSQNLMRQYQDSQRRIKIVRILIGNSQQFADLIRAKEDSIRSVLYKSYQSIVNSSMKDSQVMSEEIAKSSESSATTSAVELVIKEKETSLESIKEKSGSEGSVAAAKTAAVSIDVDDDHSTHSDSEKPANTTELSETPMPNDSVEVDVSHNKSHAQFSAQNTPKFSAPNAPNNMPDLGKEKSSAQTTVAVADLAKEKEMESHQMDIGCRFYPTDQELIACVAKKVVGETTPKFIEERDLYGSEEPQELFKANPSAIELYFFTLIKKKFDTGTRSQRLVGNGTWKIQGTKDIYDDPRAKNKVIGYKKTLNFMHFKSKNKEDSWIMHEYTLNNEGRWAICRIKRGRDNNFGLASTSSSLAQTVPVLPQTPATVPAPPASLKRPLEKDDVELERSNKRLATAFDASDGLLQLALASESMVSLQVPTTAATTSSSDRGHDHAQQTPSSSRAFPKSCINFL